MDDETLEPIPLDADGAATQLPSESARSSSRARALVAGTGIVALAAVGALAVSALTGGGGADTPEGAVRQLASAIDAEDPLAAADVLAPDEVRTLRETLDSASKRAAELELVERASAPLAGIDLSVDGLELETETLADGYAKVLVRSGGIAASTDRSSYAELLREATAGADDAAERVSLTDLAPDDLASFVMTVRRDGQWYVSAAYTVLEYVRVAGDLPPADFGSGARAAAQLGAESPEAAARETVDAVASGDWPRLLELLAPDEIPLYDYRAALTELLEETGEVLTVSTFDASAQIDGDRATLSVRAAGTFESEASSTPGEWELSGECLHITEQYEYDAGEGVWTDDGFLGSDGSAGTESSTFAFCLDQRGLLPIGFGLEAAGSPDPVTLTAVRSDGRWYLSPVSSALAHLDGWVAGFDRRHLLSLLGLPQRIEPEGAVVLGEPVTGHSDGFGLAYTYRLEGRAGQEIVGATEGAVSDDFFFGGLEASVFGPDGEELESAWGILDGQPVSLPETGTYTLAVSTFDPRGFTFTLWDVEDAPDEVVDPYPFGEEECTFNPDGSIECVATGEGSTTATVTFPSGEE